MTSVSKEATRWQESWQAFCAKLCSAFLPYRMTSWLAMRPWDGLIGVQRYLSYVHNCYMLLECLGDSTSWLTASMNCLPEARSELTELANLLVKANACVFISSRPVHNLPQPTRIGDPTPVLIRLEYQQSSEIETYVEQSFSTMKQLNDKPLLREAIRKQLLEGANGMYVSTFFRKCHTDTI